MHKTDVDDTTIRSMRREEKKEKERERTRLCKIDYSKKKIENEQQKTILTQVQTFFFANDYKASSACI
jgi:hypothetical protein